MVDKCEDCQLPDQDRRHYDSHIARLEERLQSHIDVDARERQELKDAIHNVALSVDGLVQAWRTANGIGTFLKWLAGIATAIGVLYAFFSGHWHK